MATALSPASKSVVAPSDPTAAAAPQPRPSLSDEIQADAEPVDEVGADGEAPGQDSRQQRPQQQRRPGTVARSERPASRVEPQLSKAEQKIAATIRQHYYPEGGWGWVVCACVALVNFLTWGLQLNYGVMHAAVVQQFGDEHEMDAQKGGSS